MGGNRWRAVLRDVAIVWLFSFAATFFVGMAGSVAVGGPVDQSRLQFVYGLAASFWGIIAFTIVASLAPVSIRWRHTFDVVVVAWITSAVNVVYGEPVSTWMQTLPLGAVFAVFGVGFAKAFSALPVGHIAENASV